MNLNKKIISEARKIAHPLSVADPLEGLDLIPSIQMAANKSLQLHSRCDALFWPLQTPCIHVIHMYTYIHAKHQKKTLFLNPCYRIFTITKPYI